jgi:hypothetical protein
MPVRRVRDAADHRPDVSARVAERARDGAAVPAARDEQCCPATTLEENACVVLEALVLGALPAF